MSRIPPRCRDSGKPTDTTSSAVVLPVSTPPSHRPELREVPVVPWNLDQRAVQPVTGAGNRGVAPLGSAQPADGPTPWLIAVQRAYRHRLDEMVTGRQHQPVRDQIARPDGVP